VEDEVEIVSVEELEIGTEDGAKFAEALGGRPLMLSATEPAKPSNDDAET